MRTTIIDNRGRHWGPNEPGFLQSIDASRVTPGLLDYVVRNLGFAVVSSTNRSLQVRVRPAIIGPVAIAETLTWCMSQQADRAMLTYFGEATEDWTHVLLASVELTTQRLVDLVNDAQVRPTEPFQRSTIDIDRLPVDHPVRPVVSRWRETGGKFQPAQLQPLLDRAFARRHMVVKVQDDGAQLIMTSIAAGYRHMKPSIQTGTRIEDQLDYAYGRWVAESYREVHRRGLPSFEQIDATLRRPQQRIRYERLILPCETPTRERLLLSGTLYN